jgi:lipoprotein-releasing system permease protein
MFLILTLIILIASFNIISGLVMLVKDKTKDIGIMKTMGASNASILRIFLMTGSTIGVFGTIVGALLGIFVTINLNSILFCIQQIFQVNLFNPEIYFLTSIPAKLNYVEVAYIEFIAIALAVLATIYPSLRASKLEPVDALRSA